MLLCHISYCDVQIVSDLYLVTTKTSKMQKKSEQSWWDKYSNEEVKGIKKVDG